MRHHTILLVAGYVLACTPGSGGRPLNVAEPLTPAEEALYRCAQQVAGPLFLGSTQTSGLRRQGLSTWVGLERVTLTGTADTTIETLALTLVTSEGQTRLLASVFAYSTSRSAGRRVVDREPSHALRRLASEITLRCNTTANGAPAPPA